jgi:predicted secreted protein
VLADTSLMGRRRSLTSQLFRIARDVDTAETVAGGNPRRIARRTKNIAVGRTLGRAGLWRQLWK